MPAFVVGNEGINKIVYSEGSNLLSAFKNYIWMKQRESSRTGASNLKKVQNIRKHINPKLLIGLR